MFQVGIIRFLFLVKKPVVGREDASSAGFLLFSHLTFTRSGGSREIGEKVEIWGKKVFGAIIELWGKKDLNSLYS